MREVNHNPSGTNAGILFLRFLAAHLLALAVGMGLSLLTLPLWTRLVYWASGREMTRTVVWEWYLLVLAPFYVVISSLAILLIYTIWTGGSERIKSWQRVLWVTVGIHLPLLVLINAFVGGRSLP